MDPIEAMTVSGTARESTWNPAADAKLAALKGIISAGQAAKAHRCVVSGGNELRPCDAHEECRQHHQIEELMARGLQERDRFGGGHEG